jgi:deazaflavin-dependent oxidoreductase (nitroreductase family)
MSGIAGADLSFCYVTTVGRRTGRAHTIEIWFAAAGRTLYLLAGGRHGADWVRNIKANHHVGVRLADRRYTATARVLDTGTEEDVLARRLLLAKYQQPGAHDLERWGQGALAVAIDLGDCSA